MSKVLVVHDGRRERELLLVERLVVGRDPACDISVDDGLLSRRHAEFVAAASAITVRDLGSRNGIFVNGTRRAEQALKPGDVVQIGPLRVRYVRDRVATPGAPSPADVDGTLVIPATAAYGEATVPAPPSAMDVFRAISPDDAADALNDEGETRVGDGVFTEAVRAAAVENDASAFTPTPRPAPMPLVAAPVASEPLVAAPPAAHASALAPFVLVQFAVLAVIVFVATVAPLVVSRSTVIDALDHGSVTAFVVWPILPLVIAFAATVVIANIVNRRVADAIAAGRQDMEGR